jgi:hypothetical protein
MSKGSKDFIVNEIKRANNIINVIRSKDRLSKTQMIYEDPRGRLLEGSLLDEEYNPSIFSTCRSLSWSMIFSQRTFFFEKRYFLQVEVMSELPSYDEFLETNKDSKCDYNDLIYSAQQS